MYVIEKIVKELVECEKMGGKSERICRKNW